MARLLNEALQYHRPAARFVVEPHLYSQEQLKEEFHNRMAEFRVEEKRDLEQMLFTDEDAAKAALGVE